MRLRSLRWSSNRNFQTDQLNYFLSRDTLSWCMCSGFSLFEKQKKSANVFCHSNSKHNLLVRHLKVKKVHQGQRNAYMRFSSYQLKYFSRKKWKFNYTCNSLFVVRAILATWAVQLDGMQIETKPNETKGERVKKIEKKNGNFKKE